MAGRVSAFAVLGLKPGADAAAVEQAYKRLIKMHHPDREGGDAGRAAEITEAYRELRGAGRPPLDPLEFNEEFRGYRKRPRWPLAALIAGAAIGALVLVMGPSVPLTTRLWAARTDLTNRHSAAPAIPDPMNDQLHVETIDAAVRQAVRLFRTGDEMALAAASQSCQQRFRSHPSTRNLDRCAAFDDAVVGLQDRDPLRDAGPFAALAVTRRQWSAASTLSDDEIEIDDRLDQIRLRVELALAPGDPASPITNAD
jgi:hypothetical protein